MVKLNEEQESFLAKRRMFTRYWPLVGSLLLLGIIGLFAWMFIRNPLLINPFEVASRMKSGTMEKSTLAFMACILPLMSLGCLCLLTVAILFAFVAFSNEKKYLKIIDLLLEGQSEEASK